MATQDTQGPQVGIIQIDNKPATAVRFERGDKDGRPSYNVSFMMDNKTVARLKGLDDMALDTAVGEKNAKTIREAQGDKGTLKGSTLANEYGLSPKENERRIAEKEERKRADFDRMQPDDPTEKNVVSPEPEKLEEIDAAEALARAARLREIDRTVRLREIERQQRAAAEQNRLGQQAEGKRIKVENLSEKAQEQQGANLLAERAGSKTDYRGQVSTEREKNRQLELMERLHSQFRVSGAKFHFKDQPQRVAFTDKGTRMVSASNDERVAHAMATMAEAKGWQSIRVSGHPDFQREVWMEATLRGIEVRGFKPQEKELKELEARRDSRSKNVVEREGGGERQQRSAKAEQRAKSPEERQEERQAKAAGEAVRAYAGRVLDHGEAPYNHDPKEKANYFVKLASDKGEQTVWGVDLKRAMAESKARNGGEVRLEFQGKQPVTVKALERDENGKVIGSKELKTNRNTWEVQKSDRSKVVEAVVAEVLKQKGVQDPRQRDAIMKAVSEQLQQREKAGKVPAVPVYDKNAPSTQKQPERTRPQVERHAERTR